MILVWFFNGKYYILFGLLVGFYIVRLGRSNVMSHRGMKFANGRLSCHANCKGIITLNIYDFLCLLMSINLAGDLVEQEILL